VAVVVLLGTVATNREADPQWPIAVGVALAVSAALPACLRLTPGAALLASGAATAAYFAAGYADGPVFLALPATTFVIASRSLPRAWVSRATAAGLLAALGLVGRWLFWEAAGDKHGWQVVGLLALVAASGAVATAVRARREATADRAQQAAAEERLRMARDLHDNVGHGLAVIAMQAGAALHVLDKDPARARASLEAIRESSRESLETLREELARIADLDVPRGPGPGLGDIPALVDRVRTGGLDVELSDEAGRVPDSVARAAYAVVQESLTNVLRHAQAAHAWVRLDRQGSTLVVSVTDDGGAGSSTETGGIGIAGMRARVEALGGVFEAGPSDNGFRVDARIPAGR